MVWIHQIVCMHLMVQDNLQPYCYLTALCTILLHYLTAILLLSYCIILLLSYCTISLHYPTAILLHYPTAILLLPCCYPTTLSCCTILLHYPTALSYFLTCSLLSRPSPSTSTQRNHPSASAARVGIRLEDSHCARQRGHSCREEGGKGVEREKCRAVKE